MVGKIAIDWLEDKGSGKVMIVVPNLPELKIAVRYVHDAAINSKWFSNYKYKQDGLICEYDNGSGITVVPVRGSMDTDKLMGLHGINLLFIIVRNQNMSQETYDLIKEVISVSGPDVEVQEVSEA